MKRLLTCLLALILVLTCVFAMTACGEKEDPKKESEAEDTSSVEETVSTPKEYVPAEGYKLYTKSGISFAYPKAWTLTDGAQPVMQDINGNNINMTSENTSKANNELYESLSNDNFMDVFGAAYEAMGMTIGKYDVKKEANEFGTEVIRCEFSLTYQGVKMNMYQFIVMGEKKNFVITVTEVTDISDVVDEVFKSITIE